MYIYIHKIIFLFFLFFIFFIFIIIFFAMCYFFNGLIKGLMANVSLMTKRKMKRHIDHLECIPTLGLKDYSYLYFAFDNDPEFEDEVYIPLIDSDSDDDLILR